MFAASSQSAIPKTPHSSRKPSRGSTFLGDPVREDARLLRGAPHVRLDLHRNGEGLAARSGPDRMLGGRPTDLLAGPVLKADLHLDAVHLSVGVARGEGPVHEH